MPASLCDRIEHDALQRTLPKLSHHEALQEIGLFRRRMREQVDQDFAPPTLGSSTRHFREFLEPAIDIEDLQTGILSVTRRRACTDSRVSDAELALSSQSGKKRRRRSPLLREQLPQKRGDQLRFLQPLGGFPDATRGLDQVGE